MTTKVKSFDCVAMKNRIQQELLEEYEARKSEFSSYADFIRLTASDSVAIREWRQSLQRDNVVV